MVVGGERLWNCHVHTDDIGAAIEAGIVVGRPHQIHVTDLLGEACESEWVAEALAPTDAADLPQVATAVVAVAVGAGVTEIFRSLGVQQVVTGGQSMNPSTAELIGAAERVNADQVVILPNNKNIVGVAGQVDAHTAKTVRVVETDSIVEGFASLLAYDPEAPADANLEAMREAASGVVTGDVTRAVRDSVVGGVTIHAGDHIGVVCDGVRNVAADVLAAATGLLEGLVTEDHEILTVIAGDESDEATTAAIVAWVEHERPGVEVEVHRGGQPLYSYHFGVE